MTIMNYIKGQSPHINTDVYTFLCIIHVDDMVNLHNPFPCLGNDSTSFRWVIGEKWETFIACLVYFFQPIYPLW